MKKKHILIIIFVLILVLILTILLFFFKNVQEKKLREQQELQIKEVKKHYNDFVITNKEAKLYKLEDKEYKEHGVINKNVKLTLEKTDIDYDTKYFYIKDLDLFIKYEDVEKSEKYEKSDRYKNYIFFNNNIKTKDSTTFYDIDGNYLYTLNNSYDFQVLIKDDNRYGVVFNNELLFISNEDVSSIYSSNNTDLKNKSRIRTLTYHFIYNPEVMNCNQIICHTLDQFESHLKYLKENGYFTLKLNELELYMDGKLQIPEKSIVLTIDDGTVFDTAAITLLEKYDLNATMFVITSWVSPDSFQSLNLDLESHTHHMHNQYECKGYGSQGGGIMCLDEEYVLNDLKKSQDILGGSKYFAYPFFDFNERAITLLKKAGFKLAFIGQYDTAGYSYPGITDNFKLRRMGILSNTTLEEFISYLE